MKLTAVTENHLYSKAYRKGKKYVARSVVVYVMRDALAALLKKRNPQKKALNRVGLTVTKKIGGAVVRNRCKRIMREAYRLLDRRAQIRRGYIIIIVARESAAKSDTAHIITDLEAAFAALGLTGTESARPDTRPGAERGGTASDTGRESGERVKVKIGGPKNAKNS